MNFTYSISPNLSFLCFSSFSENLIIEDYLFYILVVHSKLQG